MRRQVSSFAVILAVAGVLLTAGEARADDVYLVHTCQGPSGEPAATDGWSFFGVAVDHRDDCGRRGPLSAGPTTGQYGSSQPFGWRFDAPPGTRIAAWTMWRTAAVPNGGPWAWNWNVFRDEMFDWAQHIEKCWAHSSPCRGLGDGRISNASKVSETGVNMRGLVAAQDCYPAPCPPTPDVRIRIHRADFLLRDATDPVFVGTLSGDLLDPSRPLVGVRTASFSASDDGGGVYRVTLEVDGTPVVSEIVDDNGGRCREPFTAAAPCKPTASGSISFDTAKLPDGPHNLQLVVSDPTKTNTARFGPVQVVTLNASAECDPAVRSSATPVLASFRGARRRTVTRSRGRATVVGRIAGVGAGTLVYLLARERRAGAPAGFVATALTAADGSFTVAVPQGPSRRLRAAYRVSPSHPLVTCSRALNMKVPARVTLRASPRRVRPGHRVRLTGRLLGGRVPRQGKLVDFQARSAGAWRTFATARSNSGGRFQLSFRFSRRAISATYPIRVRVRADASYPFALGYSRPVKVRVR